METQELTRLIKDINHFYFFLFQLIANRNCLLVNLWNFLMKSFDLASCFSQGNCSNKNDGSTSKKYEGNT